MKIWKRAWVSITRRKLNSLVLLLIVFVLANVLLTTLTVTTSLKNTKQIVLKQFPPLITVNYNDENFDANETPKLSAELADALYGKTKDIIKSYDYSLILFMTKSEDTKYSIIPGAVETMDEMDKSIGFYGTQLPTTNLVATGEAKLISGKGFDNAAIKEGKPKAIISKQFAEVNQLNVGSNIPVSRILYSYEGGGGEEGDPYFSEDVELEIAGIIEINEIEEFIKNPATDPATMHNDFLQIQTLADRIYVPNSFINPLLKDNAARAREKYQEKSENMPGTSQNLNVYPEFVLKDMEDLDAFKAEAKKVYNEKYFTITSAASEYEVVANPLNSMGDLLDMVFKITVFASIVILTLVLYIFMYLRQKEMGVFLALGERRVKIIGQLLMETMIIALIGATLAIFTSLIFSNILTDNTVSSLLTPTKELSNSIESMNSHYGLTPEIISEQVQGGLNMRTFAIFYGTMAVTIFISQIATVLYLLRLNPKKILM